MPMIFRLYPHSIPIKPLWYPLFLHMPLAIPYIPMISFIIPIVIPMLSPWFLQLWEGLKAHEPPRKRTQACSDTYLCRNMHPQAATSWGWVIWRETQARYPFSQSWFMDGCSPNMAIIGFDQYIYMYVYIYMCIWTIYLPIYPSINPSNHFYHFYLSIFPCFHLSIFLSLSFSLFLSISLSLYASISLSLYLYLSVSMSFYFYPHLFLSTSMYIYIYIHIYIYIYISTYIYIYISTSLYIYIFNVCIYMSISIPMSIFFPSLSLSIYICI